MEYHIHIFRNVATEYGVLPEDSGGNLHNVPNIMDLTGEYEDRHFIVTRGDSRISVQLARNAETVKLGRDNRFLIDDEDSPHQLAYALTKPLKIGSYQKKGCFKFVLQEVVVTDDDNVELRIADYYKHFPKEQPIDPKPEVNGKKVWL